MTKVSVNGSAFAPNMMYGTAKVQSADGAGEFGKIFEGQKTAASEVKESQEETLESGKETVTRTETDNKTTDEVNEPQENTSVKETNETQSSQGTDEGETEGELSEEELSRIAALLQNAVGDIKELLAQELGISQEELSTLLEGMGLNDMDLLNQGTLKNVLLEAKGLDMTALLTNEELYGQIQKLEGALEEVVSEVQDTLQVTDEELNALKEQVTNLNKEPAVTIEGEGVQPTAKKDTATEEQTPQNNAFAPNQNLNNLQEAAAQVNAAQQTNTGLTGVETENIMGQIMDYMKIQLNAETSSLEMQLQPENLGTLQIKISAKEGIMTAQFTTTSESVKIALESQLQQLQQQFENQNIKVDAIEVVVQTHQFESALEQGNEQQKQTEEESRKSRTRKITLNQLEEAEEIAEEDRIVAEMMAASGSTVDYLA